jgi:hypothetical protein
MCVWIYPFTTPSVVQIADHVWALYECNDNDMYVMIGTKCLFINFILFIPCMVIRTHTTLTNKCTLIIPCYVIEYSHSKLVEYKTCP